MSRWTPGRRRAVLELLEKGTSRSAAAKLVGVDESTVRYWMRHDPAFSEAVARAEAVMEASLVEVIKVQAPGDWRAAAWLLERRLPELYGQRQKVDMTFDIKVAAEAIAAETGTDADILIAEAERIVREQSRS